MECNKEDALRAKEIAEKKLALQDYLGAQKLARKAQQLFPALENISQMLAVIEVHVAALAKLNGIDELDWYGILQVDLGADDQLIKKQYRRLALLLHPDKNKFTGAEAAFKLIGEASQVLSDKHKRLLHDMKRGASSQNNTAAQHQQNGHAYQANGQYHGMHSQPRNTTNRQYQNVPSTFWTACPSCQMRYQYLRAFENQNLLCPQCRLPFLANDIACTQAYVWPSHRPQQQQGFDHSSSKPFAPGFSSFNNFMGGIKVEVSQTNPGYGGASSMPATGRTKTTTEYVQQMYQEKERRAGAGAEADAGLTRKRKDEVRREKEIEKELRRKEREQQKKAKADLRTQEAMTKLMMKRKEQAQKAAGKEKRRRLKKHLSDSSEDDEDQDDSLEDMVSEDQGMQGVVNSKTYPRRSSRSRRNVTYKVDESDDEDVRESPSSKNIARMGDGNNDGSGKENVESSKIAGNESGSKETGRWSDRKDKEAQHGAPPADMKEKLADFVKNKIRMNLNLQGGKPMAPASDSEVQGEKIIGASNEEMGIKVNGASVKGRLEKPEECASAMTGVAKGTVGPADEPEEGGDEIDEPSEEPEGFSVPDADFHNFDEDREEKDIAAGQIWALYDDQDGMPRYYVRVKEVQSCNPFKVTVSWLEICNLSEEQQLLESDFYFTCGNFKHHKTRVMDNVNMFSHIVKWEKGPKGAFRIYPRKGDIWGIYRDWEPGQKSLKSDALVKYNMVEVVTDFNEQTGIRVAPLDKVNGFKTVFKHTEGLFSQIPVAELFRFSHQVPAHKLRGDEAPGVQEGCWELDPAAVPMDLIFPGSDANKSRQQDL